MVAHIDRRATKWGALHSGMHHLVWSPIGKIARGERSSFELDEAEAHTVRKLRDVNDGNWLGWMIPDESLAENTQQPGANADRVTSHVAQGAERDVEFFAQGPQGPTRCAYVCIRPSPTRRTAMELSELVQLAEKRTRPTRC